MLNETILDRTTPNENGNNNANGTGNMKILLPLLISILLSACANSPEPAIADERQTQFKVAQMSEESGQFQSALNIYQRLYDVQPSDEVNLALGRIFYRQGEWVKAQTHLSEIASDSEFYSAANLWKARTHLRLANPEKALQYIPQPTTDVIWGNLNAVALDYLQKHDEAQAIYLSQLKSSPLNTVIRRNLVYSYLLDGDYQSARDQLDVLYELGYRDQQYSMLDAIVTLLQEDNESALRQLEQYSSPFEVERFVAQLRQLRVTE
ncbi:hypothetical protein BCU12_04855 [Vibrio sp. 10N.261.55.A7]|nr:hypothetical protein BCU12_04855 [Vibrio sp. 10N.261.55.A7]